MKKFLYITLAFICLALGTIGIFLPLLPTVPFYMATAFLFGCSSEKLHQWFLSSNLYKKHLDELVHKKSMTMQSKLTVLSTITTVMGFGFIMMDKVPIARIILFIIWSLHIIYFTFVIKTTKKDENKKGRKA